MEQQKVKRFQFEAGNLIFGGYLFCSTRPNRYWTNTYFFSGGFAVKCSL